MSTTVYNGLMGFTMNFEDWRNALYRDAIRDGRWTSLRELGEYVLRSFYERGVAPTVNALIADSKAEESRY